MMECDRGGVPLETADLCWNSARTPNFNAHEAQPKPKSVYEIHHKLRLGYCHGCGNFGSGSGGGKRFDVQLSFGYCRQRLTVLQCCRARFSSVCHSCHTQHTSCGNINKQKQNFFCKLKKKRQELSSVSLIALIVRSVATLTVAATRWQACYVKANGNGSV